MKNLFILLILSLLSPLSYGKFSCGSDVHDYIDRDFKNFGIKDGFQETTRYQELIPGAFSDKVKPVVSEWVGLQNQNSIIYDDLEDLIDKNRGYRSQREKIELEAHLKPVLEALRDFQKCREDWEAGKLTIEVKSKCAGTRDRRLVSAKVKNEVIVQYQENLKQISELKEAHSALFRAFDAYRFPSEFLTSLEYDKIVEHSFDSRSMRSALDEPLLTQNKDEFSPRGIDVHLAYKNGKLTGYELREYPEISHSKRKFSHRIVKIDDDCKVTVIKNELSEFHSGLDFSPPTGIRPKIPAKADGPLPSKGTP
jgi:hypothetical protein